MDGGALLGSFFSAQGRSQTIPKLCSGIHYCPYFRAQQWGKLNLGQDLCLILRFRLSLGLAWAIVPWALALMVSFLPKFWFQGWLLEMQCLLLFLPTLCLCNAASGSKSDVMHCAFFGLFLYFIKFYIYIKFIFNLKKNTLGELVGACKEKIKLLTSKAKWWLICIQVTERLGFFQNSEGTSKLQAIMRMLALIQLKSTMGGRCFLFMSWDPGCSLQFFTWKCGWSHPRCLLMLAILYHTVTLLAAVLLGCFPDS